MWFLLLKVTFCFEKARFHLHFVCQQTLPSLLRSQPHHPDTTRFFQREHSTTESSAAVILDRADIEIRDLQCQSGRTWQPLTCCDALVCSLADNPSRPLQQKQTDNRVHACTLSPSSHVKHKRTCRASDAHTHTHSLGSLLMSEYTLVSYERWRETASDNLNLTETSNTELHLISLLHLLWTLSQHLRACAHFILR